ncbi:MAG: hypothetical protein H5T50_03825 [Nitrososphaeria archaeon]|nr:hypothetical protein [Nitrososphaeria archaeon]
MSAKKLGCWIIVFERSSERYRNHYIAKKLVTTDDYKADASLFEKIFGFREVNEGMFFLGKFISAFKQLKDEYKLEPSKHYIKIAKADGYILPKILFHKNFRKAVEPFDITILSSLAPIGILDSPTEFAIAVVLSFSLCLFVYALWKVIDKYA